MAIDKYTYDLFIKVSESLPEPYGKAAKRLNKVISPYFWEIPASTSGKYHPSCDLGDSGLLRHSLMVYRIVDDLTKNMFMCNVPPLYIPALKFCALYHDCMKCGYQTENFHTEHTHPKLAAIFIFEHCKDIFSVEEMPLIYNAIRSHMGQWTTSKYSDYVLPVPRTQFDKALHYCDYVASRKYIEFDTDYFKQFMEKEE